MNPSRTFVTRREKFIDPPAVAQVGIALD